MITQKVLLSVGSSARQTRPVMYDLTFRPHVVRLSVWIPPDAWITTTGGTVRNRYDAPVRVTFVEFPLDEP